MDTCKVCFIGITPWQAVTFDGCCKEEHAKLIERFDVREYCKALVEVHLLKKKLRSDSRKGQFR